MQSTMISVEKFVQRSKQQPPDLQHDKHVDETLPNILVFALNISENARDGQTAHVDEHH